MPNEFTKKQEQENKEDSQWSKRFKDMSQKSQEEAARDEAIVNESVKRILENHDPEFMKKIIRDASRQILDSFIEMKLCPLLTNPNWKNCGDLEKGKEPYCAGGKFVNCPAFDRYVTHEVIARPQRKKKQKRKDKESSK
jgi:transketolase